MQFAFRWMNCLLMREISVKCTIRMWDTYLVSLSHLSSFLSIRLTCPCPNDRLKEPMHSHNFIYMFAQRFW